jgi:hypothetical protein
VTRELPKGARRAGVRVRWWQPHHPGLGQADWALDNVFVGGKEHNPNEVRAAICHLFYISWRERLAFLNSSRWLGTFKPEVYSIGFDIVYLQEKD